MFELVNSEEIEKRAFSTEKLNNLEKVIQSQEAKRESKLSSLLEAMARAKDELRKEQSQYRDAEPGEGNRILKAIAKSKTEIETVKETLSQIRNGGNNPEDPEAKKAMDAIRTEYQENREKLKKEMHGEIERFTEAVNTIKEVSYNTAIIVYMHEEYLKTLMNLLSDLYNLDRYRSENGMGNPEPRHARLQKVYTGETLAEFLEMDIPNYFRNCEGYGGKIDGLMETIQALRML